MTTNQALTQNNSAELRQALRGALSAQSLIEAADALVPYQTDMLRNKQASPLLVLAPESTEELATAMRICAAHRAVVVPFGGNSGFCGGSMTDDSASQIAVSLHRLNQVLDIDLLNNTMTVQAGCILASIQTIANDNDRSFPLSHGGEGSAHIGGCLSTNAGGNAVLRFGMARDLVLGLEVVLPDGRVLSALRGLRKDNAGYDLKQLFLGTEGTLGIITAAVIKLFPMPRHRETAMVAVTSPEAGAQLLASLRTELGDVITACEMLPRLGIDLAMTVLPSPQEPFESPHPWQVLIEAETNSAHFALRDALQEALAHAIEQGIALDALLATSDRQRQALWKLREGIALAAISDPSSLKNDQSVPCSKIQSFIDQGSAAVQKLVPGARAVPFGHIGDGNIHFNVWRPVEMAPEAFIEHWPALVTALEDTATALGGSIAAEHGIGQSKRDALARVKDPVAIDLMRAVKHAIDPENRLNPGKVVP
ncbi:MAG: FAD-binding oxidoreductase [Burkholderiaceae bacterium]